MVNVLENDLSVPRQHAKGREYLVAVSSGNKRLVWYTPAQCVIERDKLRVFCVFQENDAWIGVCLLPLKEKNW